MARSDAADFAMPLAFRWTAAWQVSGQWRAKRWRRRAETFAGRNTRLTRAATAEEIHCDSSHAKRSERSTDCGSGVSLTLHDLDAWRRQLDGLFGLQRQWSGASEYAAKLG